MGAHWHCDVLLHRKSHRKTLKQASLVFYVRLTEGEGSQDSESNPTAAVEKTN